jgi:hypothetical protein
MVIIIHNRRLLQSEVRKDVKLIVNAMFSIIAFTMESINQMMYQLPECIRREVFSYIIPDVNTIKFIVKEDEYYRKSACIDNKVIKTRKGTTSLLRIRNSSDCHEYHLSTEYRITICGCCGSERCRSHYCRGGFEDEYRCSTKLIGTDLVRAVIELFI